MREPHLPEVFRLIDNERWGWEFEEIQAIHRLDPVSSLVALDGREIVGLVTCVDFGSFASIVHVIVRKGWRKKGIGLKMMERILAELDSRGVSTVELHAERKAIEFYAPFSFRKLDEISYFVRELPAEAAVPDLGPGDPFSWVPPGDAPKTAKTLSSVLGYDEGDLQRALVKFPPDHTLLRSEGGRPTALMLSRIGRDLNAVGPWVMDNPGGKDADAMMRAFLSTTPRKRVDILAPSSSEVSATCLQACGFGLAKAGILRLARSSVHVSKYPESVLSIGHLCLI
ncbi:MAG: GNAT family N-acetyltransferase [Thermoplasmata archaeon]